MKHCIILFLIFLSSAPAFCANSTSITYVTNGKNTVLIDNIPLKSESKASARTLYGVSREGNFKDGPVMSYTGWMISGEITTMAKEPVLDLLLKNKNRFNMVYIGPAKNNKGITTYSGCWLTGFDKKGRAYLYNFRATSN
jgi:hypothetical protein